MAVKTRMVTCKSCGKEIPKTANICPSCGAKQKKHKALGVILLILGIFIVIAAVFGGSDDEDKPQRVSKEDSPKASAAATTAPAATPEPKDEVFTVGDSVSLDDIVVTLVDVSESTGGNYMTPADGNVFIICEFEIENNSSKDISVSSIMSFDAYVDDYSTSMSLSAEMSSDKNQLDGSVAAGKKMNGVIGYEVASDWSEIEVRFTPDFWSGNEFIFTYSK
ncbi:DUF5067 domain-containing protein [Pseudoflavonifractor sp. 524-17]|uniref:DUF4352 domain-containing protein n=1 Tax=Pseudoflavonifractor sp. 524-17 TaxID=2304577 RepID=UPI00325C071E